MLHSHCTLPTLGASRYIRMLCKHFAHKIDASYSEWRGDCQFPCGRAELIADSQSLQFRVFAEDLPRLQQTQAILEDHLLRFASKENITGLAWLTAEQPSQSPE